MASPFANVHPTLREPAFAGHDAPSRAEAEVFDCFIEGKIPPQIDGKHLYSRIADFAEFGLPPQVLSIALHQIFKFCLNSLEK